MLQKEEPRKASGACKSPRTGRFRRGWICALVFLFCLFPVLTQAATPIGETSQKALQDTAGAAGIHAPADLYTIIARIINVVFGLLGIIFLGLILFAGFLWMTAGGDKEKIGKAQQYIRNAIIGLIILASAFAITRFILEAFLGASDGGGGVSTSGAVGDGRSGFPSSAGSLGSGIIEYHAPERDARGVPRNVAVAIRFKEPMRLSRIIRDYDDRGTPADLTDDATSGTTVGLNDDVIKIFPSCQSGTTTSCGISAALTSPQARVRFTTDRRTFVIRPVSYLGSPTVSMTYTVKLLSGNRGLLREDGSPAFGGSYASGYEWSFEVSTVVDNTPPQIVSVVPRSGGVFAPNIIVQMNFDEALDPTSASGIFSRAATRAFTNIEMSASTGTAPTSVIRPSGEFVISNRFRTVEFVSDLACGENSCGRRIYCLPRNMVVEVQIKAATLSTAIPQAQLTSSGYDGIVDLAGNSFDGNSDGRAQGSRLDDAIAPGEDHYGWTFGTLGEPILTAPSIFSSNPSAGDRARSQNIPMDQAPEAVFDTILQSSTITNDTALIRTNESSAMADTFWRFTRHDLLTAAGSMASSTDEPVMSRVRIHHRLYLPAASSRAPQPEYYPYMLSGLQSIYQNCFQPASSQGVRCRPGTPNCCNDVASSSVCPFPVPASARRPTP